MRIEMKTRKIYKIDKLIKSIKLEPCIGSIANKKLAISGITKYPVIKETHDRGLFIANLNNRKHRLTSSR